MLLFFLVFFGLQIFVLFCCAAAGNDAASQELSDLEQLQFIAEWKKQHQKRTSAEERPFCFAILFSIHMMIHTSPPLLSFTIFFIVS